ncbi:transcription antitermination factor NusB, partial [Bombilactobacillus bombi]|uniref:transcription antitermination factor NusB n=1 Tax=Bombilactobacillus bombi TaxID=1303590 RepID=UPI002810AAAB
MSKSFNNNPRYWATQILNQVLQGNGYSNILINQCLTKQNLSAADQRLLVQLVYGVLQHKLTIDYFLKKYLQQQKHLQNWVHNLLRISVYQMHYLDRIPERAIFFEATQIAKIIGGKKVAGLVTAVLRNLQRDGFATLKNLNSEQRLSIEYSVPQWIIKQLIQQVGQTKTSQILASLNQNPRTSIRVNTTKISRTALQQQLEHDGFKVRLSTVSPVGLIIEQGSIVNSPWFEAGYCTIQ